jgi:hypothetical protein
VPPGALPDIAGAPVCPCRLCAPHVRGGLVRDGPANDNLPLQRWGSMLIQENIPLHAGRVVRTVLVVDVVESRASVTA